MRGSDRNEQAVKNNADGKRSADRSGGEAGGVTEGKPRANRRSYAVVCVSSDCDAVEGHATLDTTDGGYVGGDW